MQQVDVHFPVLSIAICTYNRAVFLRYALESLLQQSILTDKFYVIVVDNNSSDETQAVIAEMSPRFKHFEAIYEQKQGLSYARNAAIDACQTPWLAYLDDDAKARPDWLTVMVDVIEKDIFDCFGGVYLPWYYFGPPPIWFDTDLATNCHVQREMGLLPPDSYPAGGNCAYRMNLFVRFGAFPVSFGMTGKTPAYGEETALIQAFKAGRARVGFVPHMIIDHCVLPHKYSVIWQMRSAYAGGRDWIRISAQAVSLKHLVVSLVRAAYQCAAVPWVFYITMREKEGPWQKALFMVIRDVAQTFGVLGGLVRVHCKKKSGPCMH